MAEISLSKKMCKFFLPVCVCLGVCLFGVIPYPYAALVGAGNGLAYVMTITSTNT